MTRQAKFGAAQPVLRREDLRFLTGRGRYVADLIPAGALRAVFVRAPLAHARFAPPDLARARAMPGVRLVLDAAGLAALGVDLAMTGEVVEGPAGPGADPRRPLLAEGVVRHAGEAVALVVADTQAQALDAAEAVQPDWQALPVHLALAPGGAPIHAEAPENLACHWEAGGAEATVAALAAAAHRIRLEVVHNRVTAAPMEPRAAYAEWEGGRLHLCVNGQGVWEQKRELARHLGLAPDLVRVTNPDVGGGFGMKAMCYPEYPCLAAAARALGRPVAWVAERTESMLTDNAGRDLVAVAEMGLDAAHRITAYRVTLTFNLGAYNSQFGQAIQSELFAKVLTGVYDIPAAHLVARGVYTNTTPVDAYRGAGRPEAILTLERTVDEAARAIGLDPAALRRANFIRRFPHATPTGQTYDCGDFDRVLTEAERLADVAGYPARAAATAARGGLRGLGLAVYVESILGEAAETARLSVDPDGGATLYVGTQSNGQGHESVYARLVAEETGIPEDRVRIVEGDSDRIARGGGTGGSRSVTVQGTATLRVVEEMVEGLAAFLSAEWGVEGVGFDGARFGAPATNLRLTLPEAADLARARGRADLADRSARIRLPARSFPNGAHLAEVEIDPETGALRLDRYTVVDDFGTILAPNLVEGQVMGGIAQGFGQAVCEWARHDDEGQMVAGSFMDYALPRADDLPGLTFATAGTPTATNPLGMKGCGEAGTVGALAAISNAVRAALAPAGVARVDMPFTPSRIWHWLREGEDVRD